MGAREIDENLNQVIEQLHLVEGYIIHWRLVNYPQILICLNPATYVLLFFQDPLGAERVYSQNCRKSAKKMTQFGALTPTLAFIPLTDIPPFV